MPFILFEYLTNEMNFRLEQNSTVCQRQNKL